MAVERQSIGQFDVNVWSEGTGEPLLFLHGYERHPGSAAFLTRLAEKYRVLAPEQPGYGSSTGFEQIRDMTDLVLFYRSLIGSWGISQIDVVGHSTGGMLAAELAALAPQVVRRLVLVDSFGLWLDDLPVLTRSVRPGGYSRLSGMTRRAVPTRSPPSSCPTRMTRTRVPCSKPRTGLRRQNSCGRSRSGACGGA